MSNIVVRDNLVYLRVMEGNLEQWYYYDATQKPIGAGAMGTVYIGHHARNPHMLVAIKQVAPTIASIPSVRQRARLEASLAFSHPNLVEMKGCCEELPDQGPMFIISKYVQGTTIERFAAGFNKHPQRVAKICGLMMPVLDALEYLHRKGVVHMDVKPSNIMIEGNSVIKLMDLGISYSASSFSMSSSGVLGTPGYAAPEQRIVNGQPSGSLNASTDIYEAGASLYELLSGNKPYADGSAILAPIEGVSKPVMEVIAKSLKKDQGQRFSSAAEFKQALSEALKKPDTKRPEPPFGLSWAQIGMIGGGILFVVLLILSLVL